MADPVRGEVWIWRAAFAAVVAALIFMRLLPFGATPVRLPGPDIVMCLAFAWVLRRPEFVPAALIALVVLAEDMLLMRPPGLWAGLVLLGSEFLRNRVSLSREMSFLGEWLMVATVIVTLTLVMRLILALAVLPQPALGSVLVQTIGTVLTYPLVVGLSRLVFGLRKPATGEVDAFGRRL